MAFKFFDRVKHAVSGTPGAGAITLGSAAPGFQTFANAGIANADTTIYVIEDTSNAWEIGIGTYSTTGPTLTRTTVIASSNANAAISATSAAVVYGSADATRLNLINTAAQQGKQAIWIPAGAMTSRPTNGPSSGTVETATNKVVISSLDFDTTTQEHAQFRYRLPKQWNVGTFSFLGVWSHAATATNFGVAIGLQALAVSDQDAQDAAFGTGVVVTDTGGTTNTEYITAESGAVTASNTPAAGDEIVFQVYREVANAGDTMAIDMRLHGIVLFITTNAGNDA